MNRIRKGILVYILGKSSSGKDSIYREIRSQYDLVPMVIYTTRPMRSGEQEGVEYHFVDMDFLIEARERGSVIEERTYQTVNGPWTYFTLDESFDFVNYSYLGIGTLDSYIFIKEYYGDCVIVPIYIEVDDGIRLRRALEREINSVNPQYSEMCRRFLADEEDFAEDHLRECGIFKKFSNDGPMDKCIEEIKQYLETLSY